MSFSFSILSLAFLAALLAGCQEGASPAAADHAPVDSLSRNITQESGGAVHDSLRSIAPPVRRDEAIER